MFVRARVRAYEYACVRVRVCVRMNMRVCACMYWCACACMSSMHRWGSDASSGSPCGLMLRGVCACVYVRVYMQLCVSVSSKIYNKNNEIQFYLNERTVRKEFANEVDDLGARVITRMPHTTCARACACACTCACGA